MTSEIASPTLTRPAAMVTLASVNAGDVNLAGNSSLTLDPDGDFVLIGYGTTPKQQMASLRDALLAGAELLDHRIRNTP